MKRSETVERRFHASYTVVDSGCWEWQRGRMSAGYGSMYVGTRNGKDVREGAHRVSYELHRGPIPKGMYVCHHCDNKWCCNPDHLFLGTQSDNMSDAQLKGLLQRGESYQENIKKYWTEEARQKHGQLSRDAWERRHRRLAEEAGVSADHKRCPVCEEWKPLSQFPVAKGKKHGTGSRCRDCGNREAREAYRKKAKARPPLIDRLRAEAGAPDGTLPCSDCKQWRISGDFHRNKARKSGYSNICRPCKAKQARNRRAKHNEASADYRARY